MKTAALVLALFALWRFLARRKQKEQVSVEGMARVLATIPEPTRDSVIAERYSERRAEERIRSLWERKSVKDPRFHRPNRKLWRVS